MSAHCGVIGGVLSRCIRSPGHAGRHEDGHYDWSGASVAFDTKKSSSTRVPETLQPFGRLNVRSGAGSVGIFVSIL